MKRVHCCQELGPVFLFVRVRVHLVYLKIDLLLFTCDIIYLGYLFKRFYASTR